MVREDDYDAYMEKQAENDNANSENLPVNDKIGVNDNAKITQKITVNQEKILDEIKKNPYITQKELSELIKMTIPNINRNMKKLQDQGIIRRVGADKNGHWEIINE